MAWEYVMVAAYQREHARFRSWATELDLEGET